MRRVVDLDRGGAVQIRRETLGVQVYDLLRNRILRGEIAGGARLVQEPLSEEMGISHTSVQRIWTEHGLKLHLVRSFKISNAFAAKVEDIVGL